MYIMGLLLSMVSLFEQSHYCIKNLSRAKEGLKIHSAHVNWSTASELHLKRVPASTNTVSEVCLFARSSFSGSLMLRGGD